MAPAPPSPAPTAPARASSSPAPASSAAAATPAAAAPSPTPRRMQRVPAEPKVDFEAEGLLEGVEGAPREARRELLAQLAGEGCSLVELKEAVAAGRLTLLP